MNTTDFIQELTELQNIITKWNANKYNASDDDIKNVLRTFEKMRTFENVTFSDNEKIQLIKMLDYALCKNHTGKMAGIYSISTSVECNKQCSKNAACKGSICEHCFAKRNVSMRKQLRYKLLFNTCLLTTCILPVECFPIVPTILFRFESFGDLNNEIQVINYFNMATKQFANCALWTKNPKFIENAIYKYNAVKPENLNIVYSSMYLNKCNNKILEKYNFIDRIFTVYEKDKIDITRVNCGSRDCFKCRKCYIDKELNEININELLK